MAVALLTVALALIVIAYNAVEVERLPDLIRTVHAAVIGLLTILGFSIYDGIVVFDRVRENMRRFRRLGLEEQMDRSINETLPRSILTHGTTIATLLAQWGLIPMLRLGPRASIMWGMALAIVGVGMVSLARDLNAIALGFAIASMGFGLYRLFFGEVLYSAAVLLAPFIVIAAGACHSVQFLTRYFREEYLEHIQEKKCRAGVVHST